MQTLARKAARRIESWLTERNAEDGWFAEQDTDDEARAGAAQPAAPEAPRRRDPEDLPETG